MRLSLAYEMQRPVVDDHAVVEETIAQCVLADEMGFDTVWFVEHPHELRCRRARRSSSARSWLTKRIRLGRRGDLRITIRCAWPSAWR
jgi:alkanesulfonate monooxygenase SsuD/methylene tetrahydromethanopterin reductase-like flavin-dependent oxidoreductase (luciferase family)